MKFLIFFFTTYSLFGQLPYYQDGKAVYIRSSGNKIAELQFDYGGPFYEKKALVVKNNKYGFINDSGIISVPFIYDDAMSYHNGYAVVSLDGKYGYINEKGKVIIDLKYEFADTFSINSLARVKLNGLYYFINKRDQIVTKGFSDAKNFSEGYASVTENGKWGFINDEGNWVIPPVYLEAFYFRSNKCRVNLNGKWILINSIGETLNIIESPKKLEEVKGIK